MVSSSSPSSSFLWFFLLSLSFNHLQLAQVSAFTPVRYNSIEYIKPFIPTTTTITSLSYSSSSSRLWASSSSSSSEQKKTNDLPANLKRKVSAARPPVGNVIPAATKRKGAGGSSNPKLRPQGKAREAGLNNPSMLKIFGGTAKGRRLDSPSVYLRPMMGKVREAVYSTLISFGLYDYSVRHLDLFAGSGSVGLESLSRGAKHCTFCDFSTDCCDAIRRNIEWCQFTEKDGEYSTRIVHSDVIQLLKDPQSVGSIPIGETFNVVTICPPYEEVVYGELMEAVANCPAVTDDTIVLMEYPVELYGEIPHVFKGESTTMIGIRNRKYGRTVIAMYICNPTGKIPNAESRPEEFL